MSDLPPHIKFANFLSSLPHNYAKEPEQSRSEPAPAVDPSEIGRLKAEIEKLRAQLAKRGAK